RRRELYLYDYARQRRGYDMLSHRLCAETDAQQIAASVAKVHFAPGGTIFITKDDRRCSVMAKRHDPRIMQFADQRLLLVGGSSHPVRRFTPNVKLRLSSDFRSEGSACASL